MNKEEKSWKRLLAVGWILLVASLAANSYLAYKTLTADYSPTITKDAMVKVLKTENSIKNNDYETFYAYDTKGNLLATVTGNAGRVDIPADVVNKVAKSKNVVLTHNHPSQNDGQTYPLSLEDLVAASTMNAKTIRAVGKTATYSITRNGDKWQTPQELSVAYNRIFAEVMSELTTKRYNKEITDAEYGIGLYDQTLQRLATEFNLTYTKQ